MADIAGWVPDTQASKTDGWVPDASPALDTLPSHTPGKRILPTPLKQRVKDALPSRKSVAKFARPVLEGTGAGVGAVVGAAGGTAVAPGVGTAIGGVAGSALGFGMGSQIADIIEGPEATQVRQPFIPGELSNPSYRPRTVGEEVGHQVNKLKTGAELEMGGQVVGKVAGTVANKLVGARAKGLPLSDQRARYKAANEFSASQVSTPASAENNAIRQKQTDTVLNRLNTTAKPTPGQASGNYKSAALEQSISATDKEFAEGLSYNDAELRRAATERLTGSLGRGQELPRVQPRDVTGAGIVKSIENAKAPVQTAERAAWAEVPDYPMPAENFVTTGRTVLSTPMPKGTKKVVKDMLDYAKGVPHTVEGLQSVERSIKSEISKASRAGDKETARILGKLKDSVTTDFTALGEAADRGDIMVSNGKVIMPSRLQSDIAMIDEQIAAQQASGGTPDKQKLMLAVKEKGGSFMPSTGMSDKAHLEKLTTEYKKFYPDQPVPMAGSTEGGNKVLNDLQTRRTQLQATLDAAKPAEDVAAAYSAAKRYSKEEKFDRFYRGAVSDVLKTGEQATGRQITNEQVPTRFFTRQGSKDLGVALMPPKGMVNPETEEVFTLAERMVAGKQAAAEQMMPHVTEQLISKTVDANTGVMNVPRAMAWVRQNNDVLHELGLTGSVQRVIKGQIPRAIETELEAKGVDIIGNPAMTALQARKMIKRMGPAVSKLYGEPAMQALTDYGQMMEILGRNKNVSYAKGSTTAEKLSGTDMAANMAEKASGLAAVIGGHGWVFSAAKNLVKGMFEGALKNQRVEINAMLKEALTNPAAAEALMKIAKAKPADVSATAQKVLMPFIRQMQIGPDGEHGVAGAGANIKAGVEVGAGAALGGLNLVTGGGQ